MPRFLALLVLPLLTLPFAAAPIPEGSKRSMWRMLGGTPSRNMVNHFDRDIPAKFDPEMDCLWKVKLGSRSYAGPIVAGGKVYVGTNNARPRNLRDLMKDAQGELEPIDKGVLMCFEEATGNFLWQALFDKLESGMVNDWPQEGLCSTPIVEGDRLYFVTNRCTVVCADVNGLTDGRQGDVIREKYSDATDADIYWEFDMRKKLNVFPHNMSNCSPLIVGDLIFVGTSNGVDEGHVNIPRPEAPSFIALNKKTGKLVWKDNSPGKEIMHGQWSHPAYSDVPVPQVIFPFGDGWIRAFDPPTGTLLWKFDANPKNAVFALGRGGGGDAVRNDFIAAPVVNGGRLFIGVGQDPEHTDGIGRFLCIDLKKAIDNGTKNAERDVSPELLVRKVKDGDGVLRGFGKPNPDSAKLWEFSGVEKNPFAYRDYKMGRTLSTACIVDDIIYLAELPGYIHCLDAKTGKHYWQYDSKSCIWGSCYYVDGKVFIGSDNGDLFVWKHVKSPETISDLEENPTDQKGAKAFRKSKQKEIAEKYLLAKIEMDAPIRSTVCAAGGVLYVMTEKTLYAFGKPKK